MKIYNECDQSFICSSHFNDEECNLQPGMRSTPDLGPWKNKSNKFVYPFKNRGLSFSMSNYSSLGTLLYLWKVLFEDEKDFFRTTAIGHLMYIPEKQSWSSAIFCFLMSRQIEVEPERRQNEKMYFRVADKELCFQKTDFALISGLSFRDFRDRTLDVDSQSASQSGASRDSKLRKKYFSKNKAIMH
ncbi:hypothetical protein C5167_025144 [Papaver somniferum]|uniref:Uncharacterized protein n=1 Tax=Papaver somniferum TaxID=3469 RepID=A0A4Y7JUA1_PAPSO|nr:hypothetical protein C5167_025144 [Papaver somniferum]